MPEEYDGVQTCIDAVPAPEDREMWQEVALEENEGNAPDPGLLERVSRIAAIDPPLAAVLLTGKRWRTGRTITVSFMDGPAALQRRVWKVAKELEQYANLKLAWVSSGADIRITFTRGGSWSYLGTDALLIPRGKPTMQYGWFTVNSSETVIRSTTLHEFLHAFGLGHEQGHPHASIPWDKPAVYAHYQRIAGWSRAQVDAQVFVKYNQAQTNFSKYDPNSIMQYGVPQALTRGNFAIARNNELSPTDKAFLREKYPFSGAPKEGCGDPPSLSAYMKRYWRERTVTLSETMKGYWQERKEYARCKADERA